MDAGDPKGSRHRVDLKDAAAFWERQRIWYNVALVVIVILWVVFTWPHFRPALTLVAFGKMLVLAGLANLCYCAGYAVEGFIQPLVQQPYWRRFRWTVWATGMLLAILLANYWIADEIYPDVQPPAATAVVQTAVTNTPGGSNTNFPAPLAVVGFLGAGLGLFAALAAVLIFLLARKRKFARYAFVAMGAGTVVYLGMLLGFSAGSHASTLARGQEKYFCEIDCHLAYSIVDVQTQPDGNAVDYRVTLRTRFDETTTSPNRPKEAPLTPSPREARLIDSAGREFGPIATSGNPLMTPLTPGESYTTQLEFRVGKDASGLRLLLNTKPAWPDRLVIGDENSWGHKKTYFAL